MNQASLLRCVSLGAECRKGAHVGCFVLNETKLTGNGCLCKWLLVPSSPDCGYSRCGRWVSSEGSFLGCLPMSSVGGVGLRVETFDCGI